MIGRGWQERPKRVRLCVSRRSELQLSGVAPAVVAAAAFGAGVRKTAEPLSASVVPATSSPPRNPPVEFLIRQITSGPNSPPRLPTELMSAMLVAAAAP